MMTDPNSPPDPDQQGAGQPGHESIPPEPKPPDSGGDELSPSVRRLIRQYEIDARTIRGSGPDGRIRPADVIAMLGNRPTDQTPAGTDSDAARSERITNTSSVTQEPPAAAHLFTGRPMLSIVLECDAGAVLADCRHHNSPRHDDSIVGHLLAACATALHRVPEVGTRADNRSIAVLSPDPQGFARCAVVELQPDHDHLALQRSWEQTQTAEVRSANTTPQWHRAALTLYRFDPGTGLLMTPAPVADGHHAGIAISAIRPRVAVRGASAESGARIAPVFHITVSFDPTHVEPHRASRFAGTLVHTLESWTADGGSATGTLF